MIRPPKYISDALPNFLGGLAVAIVLAIVSWLSNLYNSVGVWPFIQVGLAILWLLWLIWMGFVILWVYNRYRQSRRSQVPPLTNTAQENPVGQSGAEESSPYHSCFISYSHKDEAFAKKLHADLQNEGIQYWFAPEDLKIGDKIRQTIEKSIHAHDKLLLILSANSIDSQWVEDEVETVFEIERRHNLVIIFPIRLDQTVMDTDQAWAATIRRTRHIGDFTEWQDSEAYQSGLKRLLRDLKAEATKSTS